MKNLENLWEQIVDGVYSSQWGHHGVSTCCVYVLNYAPLTLNKCRGNIPVSKLRFDVRPLITLPRSLVRRKLRFTYLALSVRNFYRNASSCAVSPCRRLCRRSCRDGTERGARPCANGCGASTYLPDKQMKDIYCSRNSKLVASSINQSCKRYLNESDLNSRAYLPPWRKPAKATAASFLRRMTLCI